MSIVKKLISWAWDKLKSFMYDLVCAVYDVAGKSPPSKESMTRTAMSMAGKELAQLKVRHAKNVLSERCSSSIAWIKKTFSFGKRNILYMPDINIDPVGGVIDV